MTRLFGLLLALVVATIAFGQSVTLHMRDGRRDVGTTVVSRQVLANGRIKMTFLTTVTQGKQVVSMIHERTYDATGKPLLDKWTLRAPGQPAIITDGVYDSKGIVMSSSVEGKVNRRRIELGSLPSPTNPMVLWFWKVQPKPGQKLRYSRLGLAEGKFVVEEGSYVGRRAITVGGKSYQVHEVEMRAVSFFFDVRGLPVRVVQGDVVMERR